MSRRRYSRIVLEVTPPAQPQRPTLGDLLSSEFFGMGCNRSPAPSESPHVPRAAPKDIALGAPASSRLVGFSPRMDAPSDFVAGPMRDASRLAGGPRRG